MKAPVILMCGITVMVALLLTLYGLQAAWRLKGGSLRGA